MMVALKASGSSRRQQLREQLFPKEVAWTGENEKGWFRAPRTLPLLLSLIASKELSSNKDAERVYLELLSRHIDSGIIEMTVEEDHAYASGYTGTRAVRTWRERMAILEKAGFIKVLAKGNRQYGYVLLVHPDQVLERLKKANQVPADWLTTYTGRKIETGEGRGAVKPVKKTSKPTKAGTEA